MKLKSTLFNMFLVLSLISLISAFLLGATYSGTEETIAQNQAAKRARLVRKVLPAFDNDPIGESFQSGKNYLYPATFEQESVGAVVESFSMEGYGGEVKLLVGFDSHGNLGNIVVLKHAETPGLGSKMSSEDFLNQFIGKNPLSFDLNVKKDGGDVDAIAAATISSRAFCGAVKSAVETFQKEQK